jgi:ParB family chromosome partitioning protein
MAENPMMVARKVMELGLSVREAESVARGDKPKGVKKPRAEPEESENEPKTLAEAFAQTAPKRAKDADTLALERSLSNLLGLAVSIDFDGAGGQLSIYYMSLEQLDDVLNRLSGGTWGKT